MDDKFQVKYIQPAVVRSGDAYIVRYHYGEGIHDYLSFTGDEARGDNPGTINFPSNADWDRMFPAWAGKRELVRTRIIDYAKQWTHQAFLVKLLSE